MASNDSTAPIRETHDRDGFLIRGHDMTRTETFTDAAFAFAVTLLVVSIDAIPSSYIELRSVLQHIPAFGLSFLLLAVFWYGHWTWSRRFGLEDFPTIALSLMLVFVMLSYVYPLKFLANTVVIWLAGRDPGTTGIGGFGDLFGLFGIYGAGFAAMALVIAALNYHAFRQRSALGLSEREIVLTRGETGAWLILALVGGLSTAVSLLTTPSQYAWPGWVYMLLPVLMPIYGRRVNRAAERAGPPPSLLADS
jgi:hypothetical protein